MGDMVEDFRVTVIIPMYNSEDTITSVLDSICNQTLKECIAEIIVINDGSVDKSREYVERYIEEQSVKIRLINTVNRGVSAARNRGMQEAIGNWIAFADADDRWKPEKLKRQIEVLQKNSNIDFLGANWSTSQLRIGSKVIEELYKANIKDLCITMFPQTSTVIMRKEIFDTIGGYDEDQKYAEDGNYFLKIVVKFNYYFLPELLIDYGGGKRGFGVSGLSADLREMYRGNVKNLKEIRKRADISVIFYFLMRVYHWVKYVRRIVITKINCVLSRQ